MRFILFVLSLTFVVMQVFLMAWNGDLYFILCFLMCIRKYFILHGTCMGLLINNNEILFCILALWCE